MLPDIPFVMYLSAPRSSGKTHLLLNLMIQEKFLKDKFDEVYFVCPSFYLDSKYSILDLDDKYIMEKFDSKKIEKIIENKNPDDEILFVFDDCICEDQFKSNNSDNILNTIAIRGRHIKVSMLITTQKTTGGSSFVRSQVDGLMVWKPRSHSEIEAIYQDNCVGALDKKAFAKLLKETTKERYSFLYINYQTGDIYKNFTKINNIE